MSNAGSQAWAFYRDVAKNKTLWTIRDDGGFPAPKTRTGQRSQPFWSTQSRVEKIIKTIPAYAGFVPYEVSWDKFCQSWVPGLSRDGLLIGVNWSGKHATGYDLEPRDVMATIESVMESATEEL